MKSHARVVVVGGGIVGCSILYYLAKNGWTDVVLVERMDLTAGTTWHAAGNVSLADGNRAVNQLNVLAYKLYREMENETGEHLGWTRTGSILIAKTKDLLERYSSRAESVRAVGIDYHMIGPDEIKRLHPLMELDGVLGAAYLPDEGVLDPSMTTHAFARAARAKGAEIYRHTKVTGLIEQLNGEWKVGTDKGDIIAEYVVIAAGFWSPVVARMAGAHVPIVPTERQYLVTEEVPELRQLGRKVPMLRDFAVPFYLRQERDGLLVGVHEPHTPYCFVDGIPDDFGQELFPVDLERGAHSLESAIARIPVLGHVGIKTEVCGPTSRTPDLQGLVGPIPGLRNVHISAGFVNGISQGSALGHVAAEWLIEGSPSVDVSMLHASRFGCYANKRFIRAMLSESHVFGTVDLSGERLAGRPARASALYDRLKGKGAHFSAQLGWETPMWFSRGNAASNGVEEARAEALGVRKSVGILDLTALAKYEVSGPGAVAFLDRLCARRLPAVGSIDCTPMLNERGQVMCFTTIARLAPNRFYLTAAPQAELHHHSWMYEHLPRDGSVQLENVTGRFGALLLSGPRAREVLAKVSEAKLSNGDFPWLTVADIDIAFSHARALRFNMVGELGWELHHPLEYQIGIYEALAAAGEQFEIVDFGFKAYDTMRLEAGWPIWGADFNSSQTAISANLIRFVDPTKEGFIGRRAILDTEQPVPYRLVHISIDVDGSTPEIGNLLFDGNDVVGYVHTSAYGPSVRSGIAFASLKDDYVLGGKTVDCLVGGKRLPVNILEYAPHDPESVRVSS